MFENFWGGNGDIIKFPLTLLYLVGLHPCQKFRFAKFVVWMNIAFSVLVITLGVIDVLQSFNLGFKRISDSLQSAFLMTQLFITCLSIYSHQDTFYEVLIETKRFTKMEKYNNNGEVHLECQKILKITNNFNVSYLILCFIVACFFCIDPLVSGNLPLAGYCPNIYWKPFLILLHQYLCFVGYAHLMGFDTSFVCIASETFVQFQLLKEEVLKLYNSNYGNQTEAFQKQLKFVVNHHNFLIDYIKKICILGSNVFLLQFFVTVLAGCIQIYIILEEGFPIEDKIKNVIFFIGQIYEFGSYCIASEVISSGASQLSDAIFYSDWYQNNDKNYINSILMIIQRSQMDFIFTGGNGFIRVNLATFTTVFKSCLSFYTCIKTMEGVIDVVQSFHLGFKRISDSLQSVTLFIQSLVNCLSINARQDTFDELLTNTKRFIKMDKFGENAEVHLESQKFFKFIKKCNNTYFTACMILAFFFCIDPLIAGNLPFAGYCPNIYWKPFLIVIHEYLVVVSYSTLLGTDTNFFCIACETIVQFKLLKEEVLKLNNENCRKHPDEFQKQLKFVVDYHNFLVDYVKKICILCSEVFLSQFFETVFIGCVQFYIVLEEGFPIEDKIKTVLLLITQIYQFGLYCSTSELISSAALQLGDAIFYSEWYEHSNENHVNSLLTIIQRSQMDFIFKDGNGFVRLNLATFTVVFKSCLSFYTYIKAMERKKHHSE